MTDLGSSTFTFGKYKDQTYEEVATNHVPYCEWALKLENPSGGLQQFVRYLYSLPQFSIFKKNQNNDSTKNKNDKRNLGSLGKKQPESKEQTKTYSPNIKEQIKNWENVQKLDRFAFNSKGDKINSDDSKTGKNADENQRGLIQEASSIDKPNNLNLGNKKKIFLDYKVTLLLSSSTTFKVLTKSVSGRNSGKWSTFLPKDLWLQLMRLEPLQQQECKGNAGINFPATKYSLSVKIISDNFECEFSGIPNFVLRAFPNFVQHASAQALPRKTANILTEVTSPDTLNRQGEFLQHLGDELRRELRPFQVCGIEFGLQKNGRVLIGDEMGLGKTLQALAIAAYYSNEWPLLVVCPSSIRFQWRDQTLRWLPHKVDAHEIHVVKSGKSDIPSYSKIFIISYDLITKNEKFQRLYKVVICDESHYLKNSTAKRTQVLVPILRQARRAILLSGTPALNKPAELYQQVACLLPEFARYEEFAGRYCEQQVNRYTSRIDYVGFKHTDELYLFMTHTIMIRRLKKDVQKELPPKLRSRIPIEISDKDLREITLRLNELKQLCVNMDDDLPSTDYHERLDSSTLQSGASKMAVTELFTLTGRSKVKGACDYISYLIQSDCKFLVFGHHKEVLDAIEEQTMKESVDYIRIDGSTNADKRECLVKRFQDNNLCKVAILSITACAHGLNLTAAGMVVFAELYWVPGVMIQAEDRCHRMGTSHSTIDIHYLIAEGTLDETVWKTLNKKWNAMTSTLNGVEEPLAAQQLAKGVIPMISDCFGNLGNNESECNTNDFFTLESGLVTQQEQTNITDFFGPTKKPKIL